MRWVSPAARNCSVSSAAHHACRRAGTRRAAHGRRAAGAPSPRAPDRAGRWRVRARGAVAGRRPAGRWRGTRRPRASTASAGRSPRARLNQPRSTTDSPADSSRRWPATSPEAVDAGRGADPRRVRRASRPARARARRSDRQSGSSTSVATTLRVAVLRDRRRANGDATSPCARALHHRDAEQRHREGGDARCATPTHARTSPRSRPPTPATSGSTRGARRQGLPREDPRDQRHQHDERRDRERGRRRHRRSDGDERRELGEALVADAAHAAEIVHRREPAPPLPFGDDRLARTWARSRATPRAGPGVAVLRLTLPPVVPAAGSPEPSARAGSRIAARRRDRTGRPWPRRPVARR